MTLIHRPCRAKWSQTVLLAGKSSGGTPSAPRWIEMEDRVEHLAHRPGAEAVHRIDRGERLDDRSSVGSEGSGFRMEGSVFKGGFLNLLNDDVLASNGYCRIALIPGERLFVKRLCGGLAWAD